MRGERRLLDLQEVDSAILRLEHRRDELSSGAEVRAAKELADAAEARVGELRLALDEEQREERRLEGEIAQVEAKLAAEEQRMYDGTIVNQKELEALQHEIGGAKQRRSALEDQVLERMERIESFDERIGAAEREHVRARAALDEVGGSASQELSQVEADLQARATEREAIVPDIDPELLELYEDLRASKKGIGAARLEDGACQGCHQTLSAVQLDRLKKTDDVKRCEHCRRILVLA